MDNRSARVKAACRSSSDKIIDRAMKKPDPKAEPNSAAARAERLTQALRANLHRRKAQARAIDAKSDDPDNSGQ
jgi:hypothetical protein